METKSRIKELFKAIDSKDTGSFTEFLSDDVYFRFGNMPGIQGKKQVGEVIQGFYDSIKALSHNIDNIREVEDVVVCNGTVNYTRHDSTTLSVPFANIFKMDGKSIREYQIYVDISELYK